MTDSSIKSNRSYIGWALNFTVRVLLKGELREGVRGSEVEHPTFLRKVMR